MESEGASEGRREFELAREELERVERIGSLGTWHWDLTRGEITLSRSARALLGMSDEERPYTYEEITSVLDLGEPEMIEDLVARMREEGGSAEYVTHLATPAGEHKDLEARMEAVVGPDGAPLALRGFFQDITERRRAEREREAVHAVTRALAEAVTVGEAIEGLLEAIAETTDWQAATFWRRDEEREVLRYERVWLAPEHQRELEEFAAASAMLELERGTGVPGVAWAERRSVWREVAPDDDLREFPRSEVGGRGGLSAILAVPLLSGDDVIGVIDLWRREPGRPPEDLIRLLESFGRQIGQFVERTRTEAQLQESRALTASVIDAALECVITIDWRGRILEWNPAAVRTFGHSREQALGRELGELIVPERHRAAHRQGLGRVREGGEGRLLGKRIEIEGLRANGEEFPVELTISRIGADPPTYTGWVRDITERKGAEEALRENRRLLAETQSLAEIGSWEWDRRSGGVRATPEAHRLLGIDPEEPGIGLERLVEAVAPGHRDSLREAIEACIEGGPRLEYVRTPLAGAVGEASVVEWFAAPVEREGASEVVQGTVQNVTREAKLEDELAGRARQQAAVATLGSQALFAPDVEALMDGAVAIVAETLDLEHCAVIEVLESGEGLLLRAGVGWEEGLVGSFVVPRETHSHAGLVLERGEPVISGDLRTETDFDVPRPLLEHGLVSAVGVVIAGDAGPVGTLGAYSPEPDHFGENEIVFLQGVANVLAAAFASERASALERSLQQAQRLDSVGKLAGGVAHDFNNLLAVILNYAEVALADAGDGVRGEIEEIKRAAERAAALTRQLLLFSRKDVTPEGIVHAAEVLAGMETILGRAIGEHLRLDLRIEAGLPPVRIAESLLEQILLNLVLNAGDAMRDGGTIIVELAGASPGVRLSVIDSGTGMPAEVLDRAFEPFFTTKPEGRGTGLGLATCYGIVQRAGGRIEIDSREGSGTRIDVFLETGAEAEGAEAEAEEPAPPGGSETVLLVEDEEPLRDVTARILETAGYTVLPAEGAAAALEIWRERAADIDVLLTDVVMPERSGTDLWRELSAERPGLEAIFMSGYSADIVAKGDESGRIMLEKPFTSPELLAAVREALGD